LSADTSTTEGALPGGADPLGGLHHLFGGAVCSASLRHSPEDFVVEELLGFEPPGEGPHHWLYLRCRMKNSAQTARLLAKRAALPARDVGFSGLKDRNAVTTQWFSLPRARPSSELPLGLRQLFAQNQDLELVTESANARKLKRGVHSGNRFHITLRNVEGDRSVIEQRLTDIREHGVPNYFGAQRFGRRGSNLRTAELLFTDSVKRLDRNARSMALSAARSHVFNAVLSRRLEEGSWNSALPGDILQFDGGRSHFLHDGCDRSVADRIASQDIHPTGPLWGDGPLPVTVGVAELEQQVASTMPVFTRGLARFGLRQQRRALRLLAADLQWSFTQPGVLELRFSLPAGAFATAVLRELTEAR
jgi:tRNA pseudouridine13 synthase